MKLFLSSGHKNFSFTNRLKSFVYAWSGIKSVLRTEHNSRIHLFLTLLAGVASIVFRISSTELMMLVIIIAMVWTAEIFNTCMEKIMDFISTQYHPQVKLIKDMASSAVMIASIAAIIAGAIIFLPKIF